MGKRGESQEGGRGDGYRDLLAAVVGQQIEDAQNVKDPLTCDAARYYIFNDEPESDEYVFGFKFALKYMNIDPEREFVASQKKENPIPN